METIEFIQTTREEFDKIKREIQSRFKFCTIRRNTQQYALGGFNINPKDYENGLTSEQIDKLCIFLKSLGYDDSSLNISSDEVYGPDQGEFSGTKKSYVMFNSGISFLMKLKK